MQDEYNTRHRKLCQPPFRSKAFLQKFAAVISTRALELVDTWQTAGTHDTDVSLQTQRLTLDVVGLTAFSHDFGQTAQIRRCNHIINFAISAIALNQNRQTEQAAANDSDNHSQGIRKKQVPACIFGITSTTLSLTTDVV